MPTTTATPVAQAAALQDAFVSSLKQGQELALSGITAWTDLAGKAFPAPAFDSIPFADSMPEARELVDASFAFVEELLAVQKDFSVKLLEAVTPKTTK